MPMPEKVVEIRGRVFTMEEVRKLSVQDRLNCSCLLNAWKTPVSLGFESALIPQEISYLFGLFYHSTSRKLFLQEWNNPEAAWIKDRSLAEETKNADTEAPNDGIS